MISDSPVTLKQFLSFIRSLRMLTIVNAEKFPPPPASDDGLAAVVVLISILSLTRANLSPFRN